MKFTNPSKNEHKKIPLLLIESGPLYQKKKRMRGSRKGPCSVGYVEKTIYKETIPSKNRMA